MWQRVSKIHYIVGGNIRELLVLSTTIFSPGLRKKLTKLSKLRGCEIITEWIRACINHFHWCVSTTKPGQENVIWAKFRSYLTHITDVHEDASNPIFNKCGHGEIDQPRNWFSKSKSMDCNYHDFKKKKIYCACL